MLVPVCNRVLNKVVQQAKVLSQFAPHWNMSLQNDGSMISRYHIKSVFIYVYDDYLISKVANTGTK